MGSIALSTFNSTCTIVTPLPCKLLAAAQNEAWRSQIPPIHLINGRSFKRCLVHFLYGSKDAQVRLSRYRSRCARRTTARSAPHKRTRLRDTSTALHACAPAAGHHCRIAAGLHYAALSPTPTPTAAAILLRMRTASAERRDGRGRRSGNHMRHDDG